MTFLGLHTKIGKQPIKDTRSSKVIAVLDVEELEELIANSSGSCVTVPLELKFGNGKQKMWFVKKQNETM